VASHELSGMLAFFNCLFERRVISKAADADMFTVPLSTIVDYRGVRIFAETLLPIGGSDTLLCGTQNGGKTYLGLENLSARREQALRLVCDQLNLKVHQCRALTGDRQLVTVAGPADLELHEGRDGHLYVLDVSRLMPPTAPLFPPRECEPLSHLYHLMRPEFVARYPEPLSSDGFSSFTEPKTRDLDNHQLAKATQHLLTKVVDEFVGKWNRAVKASWQAFCDNTVYTGDIAGVLTSFQELRGLVFDEDTSHHAGVRLAADVAHWVSASCVQLCRMMHRFGINLRFLGVVYVALSRLPDSTLAMDVCLVEMMARCVKILLRRGLRNTQHSTSGIVDHSLLAVTTQLLNLAFGTSVFEDRTGASPRVSFWTNVLGRTLGKKFFKAPRSTFVSNPLPKKPGSRDLIFDIRDRHILRHAREVCLSESLCNQPFSRQSGDGRTWGEAMGGKLETCSGSLTAGAMWFRVVEMTDLRPGEYVARDIHHDLHGFFERTTPFRSGDIRGYDVRAKSLNVVARSMGYLDRTRARLALRENRTSDAIRLAAGAFARFGQALSSSPDSSLTLRNLALVLEVILASLTRIAEDRGEDDPTDNPTGMFARVLEGLELFLRKSVRADPNDIKSNGYLGAFYLGWKPDFVKAKEQFDKMMALQGANPSAPGLVASGEHDVTGHCTADTIDELFEEYAEHLGPSMTLFSRRRSTTDN
jgi:Clustered mitochondria/Translation initiation factor eIF3 subunit 135